MSSLALQLAIAGLASALVGPAQADTIPPCRPPRGVVARAPTEPRTLLVLATLRQRLGEIAAPDAEFDSTDIVETGVGRRLIFVWQKGPLWVVATEHGGRGYNDPIFMLRFGQEDSTPELVGAKLAFPDSVCKTVRAVIGGAPLDPWRRPLPLPQQTD